MFTTVDADELVWYNTDKCPGGSALQTPHDGPLYTRNLKKNVVLKGEEVLQAESKINS